MTMVDLMTKAYLEAVMFTEAGPDGPISSDAEFSPLAKAQAWRVCHNFVMANSDILPAYEMDRAGHDLWLTRNGHGAGFWDRPTIWGSDGAEILTRCAKCLGNVDAVVGDDGLIYFE